MSLNQDSRSVTWVVSGLRIKCHPFKCNHCAHTFSYAMILKKHDKTDSRSVTWDVSDLRINVLGTSLNVWSLCRDLVLWFFLWIFFFFPSPIISRVSINFSVPFTIWQPQTSYVPTNPLFSTEICPNENITLDFSTWEIKHISITFCWSSRTTDLDCKVPPPHHYTRQTNKQTNK